MSIRLDRVQLATMRAITLATGAVGLWAPSKHPRRALGSEIITARLASGPEFAGLSTRFSAEPTTVRWTVTSVTAGDRTGIFFGGRRWYHDVTAGQTVTQVRDAVRTLISETGVTETPISTNALDLSGAVGLLHRPVAIGASTVAATASSDAEITTGTGLFTVEFQAYASGSDTEAMTLISELIGGMRSYDVIDELERFGVTYHSASPSVDLTALAGADWETRASARLRMSTRFYRAVAVDTVDEVDVVTTVRNPTDSFTASEASP